MNWFGKKEKREVQLDPLLLSLVTSDNITQREALSIPSVSECVDIISGTVAMLPIKLYREENGEVKEILSDPRVYLLNDEPGGLMDSFQMKKAWVTDYLLDGRGYLYIQRNRNEVKSLRYVESAAVSPVVSADPIFKTADIYVGGTPYRDFEFVKIIRRTRNGVTGRGIVEENQKALAVTYNSLVYENFLVKTGGNKKGFLKAAKKLDKDALTELKASFKRLYQNNTESVVVLNNGLEFQESSNTSVEMQLNENKKTNAVEMCKLFCTPPALLDGTAKDEEYALWVKICITPILAAIETALNKDLLLYSEKRPGKGKNTRFYFAVDTKELLKGDIAKRFMAYQMAVDSNIMGIDEVRYREDLPALGLNFIKLGLQDVLYDPITKQIYTPNTGKTQMLTAKGGEPNEN